MATPLGTLEDRDGAGADHLPPAVTKHGSGALVDADHLRRLTEALLSPGDPRITEHIEVREDRAAGNEVERIHGAIVYLAGPGRLDQAPLAERHGSRGGAGKCGTGSPGRRDRLPHRGRSEDLDHPSGISPGDVDEPGAR